jgi:hypothetical protein
MRRNRGYYMHQSTDRFSASAIKPHDIGAASSAKHIFDVQSFNLKGWRPIFSWDLTTPGSGGGGGSGHPGSPGVAEKKKAFLDAQKAEMPSTAFTVFVGSTTDFR